MIKLLLVAAFLTISLGVALFSQTKLDNSSAWYAVKITYNHGNVGICAPIYKPYKGAIRQSVSPTMRINTKTNPEEQVTTILVSAAPESNDWAVRVWVVFDGLYNQGKKRIATRRIRIGESTPIEELAQFGVIPFEVSIVAMAHAAAVKPEVVNALASIKVLDVQLSEVPAPYVITIENLSSKDIQSIEIHSFKGDALGAQGAPSGTWDRPLIKAHGTGRVSFPSEFVGNLPKDPCASDQSQLIKFSSVVFSDGSYEGTPVWPALQKAMAIGSSLQVGKVLALIHDALVAPKLDGLRTLNQFKESALALDEIIPPGSFQGLNAAFPSLKLPESGLVDHARAGMDRVKRDLLHDLVKFERPGKEEPAVPFLTWLQKEKDKYERWRSTLQ